VFTPSVADEGIVIEVAAPVYPVTVASVALVLSNWKSPSVKPAA
jgi:hypothetical protein